jgi:hypothetical protein
VSILDVLIDAPFDLVGVDVPGAPPLSSRHGELRHAWLVCGTACRSDRALMYASDAANAPPVAVVNDLFVRRFDSFGITNLFLLLRAAVQWDEQRQAIAFLEVGAVAKEAVEHRVEVHDGPPERAH